MHLTDTGMNIQGKANSRFSRLFELEIQGL